MLKAIQAKLSAEIPPELAEQLGLDAGTKSLNEQQFEKVMQGEHLVPPGALTEMLAPDAAAELVETRGAFDCPDCDWTPKPNAKRPDTALRFHAQQHREVSA